LAYVTCRWISSSSPNFLTHQRHDQHRACGKDAEKGQPEVKAVKAHHGVATSPAPSSATAPSLRCLQLPLAVPLALRLISVGSRNRSSKLNRLPYNCSVASRPASALQRSAMARSRSS